MKKWSGSNILKITILAIIFCLPVMAVHSQYKIAGKVVDYESTAELKQQTTELEMQALHAQTNPHFIFNSLNSINRFILQNNRLQASEYLTKFSRLVRLILVNSQTALINLESEIESVKLYLSLESLRFDDHFEYKISVDPRRIAMLRSGDDPGSSVIINDLINADGSAAGTEVIIRIPLIQ